MAEDLGMIACRAMDKAWSLPANESWQAVADAVVAANEARRWRPIESIPVGDLHPYDEREGHATFVLYWNGFHHGVGFAQRNDEGDRVDYLDESGDYIEPPPTHWTHMPEPPQEASNGA